MAFFGLTYSHGLRAGALSIDTLVDSDFDSRNVYKIMLPFVSSGLFF